MPQKLTEMQERFAVEYASNGGNATAAAKAAGYSEISAHELGRQLLEKPHVQEAVHRCLIRTRFRSGAIGLEAMIRIAEDAKAPAAARVSAARALMEHAGMVGTAKEVLEEREKADKGASVIDYQKVIDGLAARRANSNGGQTPSAEFTLS